MTKTQLEKRVEELEDELEEYENFYLSILHQIADLYTEEDNEFFDLLTDVVMKAEIDAGWESENFEY